MSYPIVTGQTFATGDQVTATKLNNIANLATFDSDAVDNVTLQVSSDTLSVKDGGITTAKLSTGAPTWNSSGDLTATRDLSVIRNASVTGTATIGGLITATAGQIAFPATQNPSADANTLDDYEEGTWTPSLGGTATYTLQSGRYTKIGRLVSVSGRLTVNSIGSGDTGTISGLPFTAGANAGAVIGYFQGIATTGYVSVYAHVVSGTSTIQTSGMASGADGVTSPANFFKSGTDVIFSATYSV